MRSRLALFCLVALCSAPVFAQNGELGLWVAASQVGDTRDDEANLAFDNGLGFGISLNQYWGNISFELGATALTQEEEISADTIDDIEIGDLDLIPITAMLQLHFLRNSAFSPYIGAGAAYILADDLSSGELIEVGPIEIEDEFTWALQAGVNINLSRSLAIGLDAKYISYTPGAAPAENRDDEIDLDLNPLIFSAGVKFRW